MFKHIFVPTDGSQLSTDTVKREGGAFVLPASPEVAMVPGTWRARLRQGVVTVGADGSFSQTPLDRPVQLAVLVDTRPRRERSRLQVAFRGGGVGRVGHHSHRRSAWGVESEPLPSKAGNDE